MVNVMEATKHEQPAERAAKPCRATTPVTGEVCGTLTKRRALFLDGQVEPVCTDCALRLQDVARGVGAQLKVA
jgi:hypothetical protein